jgi:large subunit ribosomal protein L9
VKVILRERVKGLGEAGVVVEVAPGYARNYLLPRKLAEEANDMALREARAGREREAARAARALAEARAAAGRIEGATVTVTARAGESGRLFGSVTGQDLADALAGQLGVRVDRRRLDLAEPIKTLGAHPVTAKLHAEVQARFTVQVVAG